MWIVSYSTVISILLVYYVGFLPRFLWGFHVAIILAIALKTTIKTLRSIG